MAAHLPHSKHEKQNMEKGAVDLGVRKGAWTKEEDTLLTNCIHKYGEGRWHLVPLRAGLNRCRKSCRLRWLNYLNPNVKRGLFTRDEVDLIVRMHKLLGNKWTLIAGRIPGRTANDVKNFWNTHIHKRSPPKETHRPTKGTIRPQPRTLDTNLRVIDDENGNKEIPMNMLLQHDDLLVEPEGVGGEGEEEEECMRWWADLLETSESKNGTRVPFSISEDEALGVDVDVWELVSMNNQ